MDITELYEIFKNHPEVTTDSRSCPPGSIFFALKGERFDGNKYAAAALEKGCSWAVVDEAEYAVGDRCVLVGDCLETLRRLALLHRRTLGTPIIGITGTNGKTTTKELVAAVLGKKYDVLYTQGNFNNDIGVPKTLLRLNAGHDIAVVEMGASHPGDIRRLVEIVEPDYAIITNVGRAHLQGFGSFEGVVRTKGELYDFMRSHAASFGARRFSSARSQGDFFAAHAPGRVFIDNDNPTLLGIAGGLSLVKYGCGGGGLAVSGHITDAASAYLRFSWSEGGGTGHPTSTALVGDYNIHNVLAAVCVGRYFGVGAGQITDALSSYEPTNNRSECVATADNTLVIDAYNANPTSMAASLDSFLKSGGEGKMVILGDMRELGAYSRDEHQKVADRLKRAGLADVWLVGGEFAATDCAFRKFADVGEVKAAIAACKPRHRRILIKGSNSMHLYELKDLL